MADVSQVNLPDGSSYNVKDANALHNIIVPDYDPTSTYNLGDFVTYDGNIYICTTAISTPEAWNSNHWKLTDADQSYLHSLDPKGAGSFSLNRKDNTTIGNCSFAEGYNNTASGKYSHAEGSNTTASATTSHAEGYDTTASGSYGAHAEGRNTTASGTYSHAEGYNTTASGNNAPHSEGYRTSASGDFGAHAEGISTIASGDYGAHAEGVGTTANHRAQHTFGEFNVLDPSTAASYDRGNYVEIVGNGTSSFAPSNARTLDWNGNEVLAGGLKINGTQNVATQVELTQAEYDALVQAGTVDLVNTVYFITDGNANANSASETTYDNTSSGLSATNVQGAIDEINGNVTTYTFANGTNGFTVTPSGGSAQTVTVTPSITNNVTGSGTTNYIPKFTGANTIGNGYQTTTSVTSGSASLVTSGGVFTALSSKVGVLSFPSGSSIRAKLVDTSIKAGLYIADTMYASDNPAGTYVSFTLISKPTDNGAFSTIYAFVQGHLYSCLVGATVPSSLTFTLLV